MSASDPPPTPHTEPSTADPLADGRSSDPVANGHAVDPFADGHAAGPFADGLAADPFSDGHVADDHPADPLDAQRAATEQANESPASPKADDPPAAPEPGVSPTSAEVDGPHASAEVRGPHASPESGASPAPVGGEPLDARLLVPAGAGWLAAVLLVGQRPLAGLIMAAVALTVACALGLILRRPAPTNHVTSRRPSRPHLGQLWHARAGRPARVGGAVWARMAWAVVGVLVVVAGMGVAAGLQVASLRAGPVQGLATDSATVGVRLKVEGDPSVRQTPGGRRPPYVVLKATIVEVRARGV